MITCKAAAYISSTSVALLFYAEEENAHASLATIKPNDGEMVWGLKQYGTVHGEGTDIKVSKDRSSIIIAGQGAPLVVSFLPVSKRRSFSTHFDIAGLLGLYLGD